MRRTPEEQSLDRLLRHRYGELVEAIASEQSFTTRSMFHCLGCYLHGRLTLVLADRTQPWDGILLPTTREDQASLRGEMPALRPHPVLGKWLYLAASVESFEDDARRLVELALAGDPRVGVEPQARRARGRARRRRSR